MRTQLRDLTIGKFRDGQERITEAKNDDETLAWVSDGDVTTYAYSLPSYFSRNEFAELVGVAFGEIGEPDNFTITYPLD